MDGEINQLMMRNEILIYIKLLAINPDTNRAFVAPCEIQPQIAVNLYYYIDEYKRDLSHNSAAYKNAIEEILQKSIRLLTRLWVG